MIDDIWEAEVVEYEPDYIDEDSAYDDWIINKMEIEIGLPIIKKEE